ncbi:MAG: GTP cyclohydrolase II [Candidatus Nanoarchaeia archaeon]|nr:GTP cyclohydrolase II [Candidatus Nanoarchaeia archaeon]
MEETDSISNLKYRMDGKFKMPCKLADGTLQKNFTLYLFSFLRDNKYIGPEEHFHVLVLGNIQGKDNVLTRIESACTYAHLYGSQLCDCQFQLQEALIKISKNQSGIYIYCLDQHGRGTGIVNHVKVYQAEQELGLDTVQAHLKFSLPADARNYEPIITILNYFNVKGIKLMTNNPKRLDFFRKYNIPVERIPHQGPLNSFNKNELKIKKEKLGHLYAYEFK